MPCHSWSILLCMNAKKQGEQTLMSCCLVFSIAGVSFVLVGATGMQTHYNLRDENKCPGISWFVVWSFSSSYKTWNSRKLFCYLWMAQNLGSQGAMAQASFTMGLAIDRRISSSITQHNGSNSFLKENSLPLNQECSFRKLFYLCEALHLFVHDSLFPMYLVSA